MLKLEWILVAVISIMGVSSVVALGQSQPEMRFPMTPSSQDVSLPFKICKRGHHRALGVWNCPRCQKERAARWHRDNHAHVAARLKKWRHANHERTLENQRRYMADNREKYSQYAKNWYQRNIEFARARDAEERVERRTFYIWKGMIARCAKPSTEAYKDYGGRGIKVCASWTGIDGFANFLADMGDPPTRRHSLDRRDPDGNYEAGNCRWATPKEQARNKRSTRRIEFMGKTQSISDWAEELGIPFDTLNWRLRKMMWPPERALTEPVSGKQEAHKKMTLAAMECLRGSGCHCGVREGVTSPTGERPDAIGWYGYESSCLIECKRGRCDFKADLRKRLSVAPESGVGRLRYYMCRPGLIDSEEIPSNWGLLYHQGESIVVVKQAVPFVEWNKAMEEALILRAMRKGKMELFPNA